MGFFSRFTKGINEFKGLPVKGMAKKILDDHKQYGELGAALIGHVGLGAAAGAYIAGEDNRLKGAVAGGALGAGLHSMDYLGRVGIAADRSAMASNLVNRRHNKMFASLSPELRDEMFDKFPNRNISWGHINAGDNAIQDAIKAENIGGHFAQEIKNRAMKSPFGLGPSLSSDAVFHEVNSFLEKTMPTSRESYKAAGMQAYYDAIGNPKYEGRDARHIYQSSSDSSGRDEYWEEALKNLRRNRGTSD